MTCKDCIHYEVCQDFKRNICTDCNWRHSEFKINRNGLCDYFKDKSLVLDLPCKVGGAVYVLNRAKIPQKMILDEPDIRCHCADEDNLCGVLCGGKENKICAYRFMNDNSDIGRKVFLTKEAAQQALKEMK